MTSPHWAQPKTTTTATTNNDEHKTATRRSDADADDDDDDEIIKSPKAKQLWNSLKPIINKNSSNRDATSLPAQQVASGQLSSSSSSSSRAAAAAA